MRNLECTPESTEFFSHPTYLSLKDAIDIVKHQDTPGTKSSSLANNATGKNNLKMIKLLLHANQSIQ